MANPSLPQSYIIPLSFNVTTYPEPICETETLYKPLNSCDHIILQLSFFMSVLNIIFISESPRPTIVPKRSLMGEWVLF